jgi:hypothetical protein
VRTVVEWFRDYHNLGSAFAADWKGGKHDKIGLGIIGGSGIYDLPTTRKARPSKVPGAGCQHIAHQRDRWPADRIPVAPR